MAEISISPGFRNEQVILRQLEGILKEMGLDGKLCNVYVKQPPAESQIDNNYLKPRAVLDLEVVDSLENLEGRLRHELMHVADQVVECFGYKDKKIPRPGTALLRRYKYLWNVYIDSRLIKAGKPAYATYDQRKAEIVECWPEFSEETRKDIFEYLWNLSDTGVVTQKQLLQLSKDIFKLSKSLKDRAKARGEKPRKFKTIEDLKHFERYGDIHK
jgi:hypothetical protein